MDGVTEKFTIFDYLNAVIGGIVFLLGVGCFTYSESKDVIIGITNHIGDSTFLLIMAIIVFIALSSVIGLAFNTVCSFFF